MRGFRDVEVCRCATGECMGLIGRVARHSEARIVDCANGEVVLEK